MLLNGYSGLKGAMIMLINAAERANGQNGKTTFMSLVTCMIDNAAVPEWKINNPIPPGERVANGTKVPQVSIDKWSKDFTLASMIRTAMLLVSDENSGGQIQGSDFIKNAARHQPLEFQEKFRNPFIYTIMCLILHAQNEMVRFKTKDGATFEHMIVLMMDQDFSVKGKCNPLVKKKYVVDKRVHEYLLWKVLTQMPLLEDFTPELVDTVRVNIEQTKRDNIPVYEFLDEIIPMFNLRRIPLKWLFEIFKDSWQPQHGEVFPIKFKTFKQYVMGYVNDNKDEFEYLDAKFQFDKDDRADIERNTHPALEEYGIYDRHHISFGKVDYDPKTRSESMKGIKSEYADKQFTSGGISKKNYVPMKDANA